MNGLRAFGARTMPRVPGRQSAEIRPRIALMNRFNALGPAGIGAIA